MAMRSHPTGQQSVAGVVLEATTPVGRRWSSTELAASTRTLRDPDRLLAIDDVITVHHPRTRERQFLLQVTGRDGEYVRLRWLGRDG